ncbi:unnamed protein product [Gongylonema pulchrum]|uniref:Protein kinase domain-containing protein n=1 Tax=Gongylonema pulchrum TaxID=637853 RepID=A0A183DSK0_9BILA|nr:unnamed protein product [Gongylonema pulchrum]
MFRSKSDYIVRFLPRELKIVPTLNHNNVVKVYDVSFMSKSDYIVRFLPRELKIVPTLNHNNVVKYLKANEIAHRDLKCENIFLDRYGNIKLGDFGFSRIMHNGDVSYTFCGSKGYVPPEILKSQPHIGFYVDLWSLGVVMFVTVTGLMPYDDRKPKKMLLKQLQHRCNAKRNVLSNFRSQPHIGFYVDLWSLGVVMFVTVTGLMPYDDRKPKKMLLKQLQHRLTFPEKVPLSEEVKLLIFDILHPVPEKRKPYPEILKSSWLVNTPYHFRSKESLDPIKEEETLKNGKK